MRIKVTNPNTTACMTATIAAAARAAAGPGTEIVAATSPAGPASIEGHHDEAMSLPGLLAEVRAGEVEGVDGHVIACFGDPGLLAARGGQQFYNGRGTAEQWIKEGKQRAPRWTRVSCRTFRDDAVQLQLFALAYNLANFLRSLALPNEAAHWSLTT